VKVTSLGEAWQKASTLIFQFGINPLQAYLITYVTPVQACAGNTINFEISRPYY